VSGWPDGRFLALSGARLPVVQAPMAGAGGVALAVAAIKGGAVGSLPCALLSPDEVRDQVAEVRAQADGPLNLNFFCHDMPPPPDQSAWLALLEPYYRQEGVAPPGGAARLRQPFDEAMCRVVEAVRPTFASFHFGLPDEALLQRVRAAGVRVIGNATTPEEAAWLALRGCDAIVAQGFEAGGHAGYFLKGHRPVGLFALVRQMAGLPVPVIAAGGIVDAEGVAAALMLGASAVQVGTAYLAAPESLVAPPHRRQLGTLQAEDTVFTNLFSGREARGMRNRLIEEQGPVSDAVPHFPYASAALAPLRAAAEAGGRGDYSQLWAGQAAALVTPERAQALTDRLGREALALLSGKG